MKENLQQLVAKNLTEQAIQELKKLTSNKPELHNKLLLLEAKFNDYQTTLYTNTDRTDNLGVIKSQIDRGLLQIIDQAFEQEVKPTSINQPTSKKIHWWHIVISIGVIIGILAGIAEFTGYNLQSLFGKSKANTPLQLTIYVHGPKGKQDIALDNEGKLIADFGNRRDSRRIGEDGRTNFGEIDRRFLGKEIGLSVEADGFEAAHPDRAYIYNGEPIYLAVGPASELGLVQGKVRSRDGSQFLPGVLIEVSGETTRTDSLGNFYLVLPKEKWREEYNLHTQKDGYQLKEEKYYPKLGEIEIRLTPKNDEK